MRRMEYSLLKEKIKYSLKRDGSSNMPGGGDTRLRVEDDADVVGNDFGRSFLLLPDGKHFTQTSYHERQRLCSVGSL
jgi:hypothetical protein